MRLISTCFRFIFSGDTKVIITLLTQYVFLLGKKLYLVNSLQMLREYLKLLHPIYMQINQKKREKLKSWTLTTQFPVQAQIRSVVLLI